MAATLQTLTTSSAKFRWVPQANFNDAKVPNFKFGLDQKIPAMSSEITPIDLEDSGERTLQGIAHGSRHIMFDPSFAMTQPWWIALIFPLVKKTAASATKPTVYSFEKQATPLTFSLEARLKGTDAGVTGTTLDKGADMKYALKGCVVESASISCAVDQTAQVRMQCKAGQGTLTSTSFAAFSDDTNTDTHTYTSVGGKITLEETSSSTAVNLAYVSDGTIDIQTGQEIKNYWGSVHGLSAKAGAMRFSGTIKSVMVNSEALQLVLDAELKHALTFRFSNNAAGKNERYIQFKFSGVNFSRHSWAQQSTDDLMNDLSWSALECTVTAGSKMTSAPVGINVTAGS